MKIAAAIVLNIISKQFAFLNVWVKAKLRKKILQNRKWPELLRALRDILVSRVMVCLHTCFLI